jgi:Domain of unknown function (DUF4271)
MLKGVTLIVLFLGTEMCPFAASESVSIRSACFRDSIINPQVQLEVTPAPSKIKRKESVQYNQRQLDSIFSISDRREKSVHKKKVVAQKIEKQENPEDTSSVLNVNIPYFQQSHSFDSLCNENFLANMADKNISQHFDTTLLSKFGVVKKIKTAKVIPIEKTKPVPVISGLNGKLRVNDYMNWVPLILLMSLFAFALIKIQYKRYVDQVITSLINYQVSLRLLRERNVLFRNMSLGMNLVFGLNLGLFIYFILQNFGVKQQFSDKFLNVLLYSGGLILLYMVKSFTCRMIGFLFKVQSEFIEYVHNINLFNKNIGLFLFPVVIAFPYINENIQPFVIYLGISILVIMVFLRTVRSIQIIMRKGVSLFYLILYLCAIEILPVLLVVKYSATLV